jgi:hypothetical protein
VITAGTPGLGVRQPEEEVISSISDSLYEV